MSYLVRLGCVLGVATLWGCFADGSSTGKGTGVGGSADGALDGPAVCDFRSDASADLVMVAALGGRLHGVTGRGELKQLHAFGPSIHGLPAGQVEVTGLAVTGERIVAAASWSTDLDRMQEILVLDGKGSLLARKLLGDDNRLQGLFVGASGWIAGATTRGGLLLSPSGELTQFGEHSPLGAPLTDGLVAVRDRSTNDVRFRKPNGTLVPLAVPAADVASVQQIGEQLVYLAKHEGAWVLVEDGGFGHRLTGLTRAPERMSLEDLAADGHALLSSEGSTAVARLGQTGLTHRRPLYPEGVTSAGRLSLTDGGRLVALLTSEKGVAPYLSQDGREWTALLEPAAGVSNVDVYGRLGTFVVRTGDDSDWRNPGSKITAVRPATGQLIELGIEPRRWRFDSETAGDLTSRISNDGACVTFVSDDPETATLRTAHMGTGQVRDLLSADRGGNNGSSHVRWLPR